MCKCKFVCGLGKTNLCPVNTVTMSVLQINNSTLIKQACVVTVCNKLGNRVSCFATASTSYRT